MNSGLKNRPNISPVPNCCVVSSAHSVSSSTEQIDNERYRDCHCRSSFEDFQGMRTAPHTRTCAGRLKHVGRGQYAGRLNWHQARMKNTAKKGYRFEDVIAQAVVDAP
jgi:hypothetical protein